MEYAPLLSEFLLIISEKRSRVKDSEISTPYRRVLIVLHPVHDFWMGQGILGMKLQIEAALSGIKFDV